jgi:hypothetical protein
MTEFEGNYPSKIPVILTGFFRSTKQTNNEVCLDCPSSADCACLWPGSNPIRTPQNRQHNKQLIQHFLFLCTDTKNRADKRLVLINRDI